MVPVPLFHCYGCVIGTMSAVNSGAAIILPNWTFDARATLKAVHDERATSVYGVPAMYVAEFGLDDFASYDTTSLRTGMMSGAPCPVELMKRVLDEMHCRELVIAYGQTETSPVVTMSDAADSLEIRVNTVGRAMPQTEIKIAALETQPDAPIETRETLPCGQQGEVCVRGYALDEGLRRRSRGHGAGDPARRLAADRRPGRDARGRMHSHHRPLARRDHSRRRKHLSARGGGVPLHPSQGGRSAGDRNSQCAARRDCGGVDSPAAGPDVEATEEEIKAFCQGQIAYYKIPEHVRFVTEFPATLSGKIQKYKMREFEIEARGLQDVAKTATA